MWQCIFPTHCYTSNKGLLAQTAVSNTRAVADEPEAWVLACVLLLLIMFFYSQLPPVRRAAWLKSVEGWVWDMQNNVCIILCVDIQLTTVSHRKAVVALWFLAACWR